MNVGTPTRAGWLVIAGLIIGLLVSCGLAAYGMTAQPSVTALRIENARLRGENAALRDELTRQNKLITDWELLNAPEPTETIEPTDTVSYLYPAHYRPWGVHRGHQLSRRQIHRMLTRWAKHYHVGHRWVHTGMRIAWRESSWRPAATNRYHAGLFQFACPSQWGSRRQLVDPNNACRLFMRTVRQGGAAAVRRHWAATYTI